jgi:hypothetical protein
LRRPHLIGFCALGVVLGSSGAAGAAEGIAPPFNDLQWRGNAAATYVANAYAIIHVGKGSPGVVNEEGSWWRPVRDLTYRFSVDNEAFFTSLGRPDLARQWANRRALGRSLEAVGYVVGAAGLVVTIWSADRSAAGVLTGLGMMLGAFVVGQVGANMPMPPFPEDRALQMTADYNRLLRAHLGLPPDGAPRAGGSFALAPLLSPSGAGLAFAGKF